MTCLLCALAARACRLEWSHSPATKDVKARKTAIDLSVVCIVDYCTDSRVVLE